MDTKGPCQHCETLVYETSPPPSVDPVVLCMCGLGEDEQDLLVLLRDRARMGAKTYGNLKVETDKRSFPMEALEELIDMQFYIGAQILRLLRGEHKKV